MIDWAKNKGGICTASWHINVPTNMADYTLGEPLDPSAIYMVGVQSTGASAVYISDVFLSHDGVTDATAIGSPSSSCSTPSTLYTTSGIPVEHPVGGVTIMRSPAGAKKVVSGE